MVQIHLYTLLLKWQFPNIQKRSNFLNKRASGLFPFNISFFGDRVSKKIDLFLFGQVIGSKGWLAEIEKNEGELVQKDLNEIIRVFQLLVVIKCKE